MMKPFTITVVAVARLNFMKIAPIVFVLNDRKRDAAASEVDLRVPVVRTSGTLVQEVHCKACFL